MDIKLEFKREDILSQLRLNREEHLKIVREAQDGYRDKWRTLLTKALEKLDSGKKTDTFLSLSVPTSHIDDFDRAIEMFELTTQDSVILDESSFQAYIRNKWDWQGQFLASNSAYSATATSILGK